LKVGLKSALPFEALYIVTFACLWDMFDWQQLVLAVTLAPFLIWISVKDMQVFEIPDLATCAVAMIGVVNLWVRTPHLLVTNVGVGLVVMGVFWAVGSLYFAATGRDGLGIGDAKLLGAGALLLGPWKVPELILISSVGGILGYGVSALRSSDNTEGIPFGPFIAYSVFILSFLDGIFL